MIRVANILGGRLAAGVLLFASLPGCGGAKPTATSSAETNAAPLTTAPEHSAAGAPVGESGPLPSIDAARAMQYTREVTAFGPRPIGSANHKKLEQYIYTHLKGDQVEDDLFTAETPAGKLPVRNIIAKFPGEKDGVIVIAGHYDTNYPLRNAGYVGANDGGSSTGLLLELANQFRGRKRDGYSVWLLWTDGEEAIVGWTDADSVYGTKHLAERWYKDGTLKKIKAFILEDMIGDADLNMNRDASSTPWLQDMILQAATRMGFQSHFSGPALAGLGDDHVPFLQRGVACVDLIDFDYGYNNVFWHTPQDTMDKLSPQSLQIVGSVILETVRMLDSK